MQHTHGKWKIEYYRDKLNKTRRGGYDPQMVKLLQVAEAL